MSNVRDLWYDWLGLNTWIFKQVNSITGITVYDEAMKFISGFGDEKMLPVMIGFITFAALMIFLVRVVIKKGGNKHYMFMWFNIFLIMGTGLAAAYHTTNYIGKNSYFPRPYVTLRNEVIQKEVTVLDVQLMKTAKENYLSFPSKHVMIITILVISIWPALTENFRWAGVWLIIMVGWSRIAMGVNYPSDFVGGLSIAIVQMMVIRTIIYSITLRVFRIGS